MTILSMNDHIVNLCAIIDIIEDDLSSENREQTIEELKLVYVSAKKLCSTFDRILFGNNA